jgi:hypothetical protein
MARKPNKAHWTKSRPCTTPSTDSGYASHATTDATTMVESLKSLRDSAKVAPAAPAALPSISDDKAIEVPSTTNDKAIEVPKPASKTALGRVWVPFDKKPEIYAAGVVVESTSQDPGDATATWKAIKSQRLRRQALQIFMEKNVPAIDSQFAINTRVGADMNHVIFPVCGPDHKDEIKVDLNRKSATVDGITKKPKKAVGGKPESIRCRVVADPTTDHYWQSLDLLIRTLASDRDAVNHQEFYRLGGLYSDKINVSMNVGLRTQTAIKASTYEVKLRTQMSLASEGEHGWVSLDFDLVPIITTKPLSEVVVDIFGGIPFEKNGTLVQPGNADEVDGLSILKHKLSGLKVSCAYVPGKAGSIAILSAKSISEGVGRSFQIKDFKFPGDHSRFTLYGKDYNVPDYFNEGKSRT